MLVLNNSNMCTVRCCVSTGTPILTGDLDFILSYSAQLNGHNRHNFGHPSNYSGFLKVDGCQCSYTTTLAPQLTYGNLLFFVNAEVCFDLGIHHNVLNVHLGDSTSAYYSMKFPVSDLILSLICLRFPRKATTALLPDRLILYVVIGFDYAPLLTHILPDYDAMTYNQHQNYLSRIKECSLLFNPLPNTLYICPAQKRDALLCIIWG